MLLEFTSQYKGQTSDLINLFQSSFSDSEGAKEGALIGKLVTDIFDTVSSVDIHVFSALHENQRIGAIVFTRLFCDDDARTAFMLSPVAVKTSVQSMGVGQKLLTHGLNDLKRIGIDVVITYGNPAYYSKVGFHQITEADAEPPHKLSQPQGWLGQSFTSQHFEPIKGKIRCVKAFDDPVYW